MIGDWDKADEDQWIRDTWEANHIWNIYVGPFKKVIQLVLVVVIVAVVEIFILGIAVVAFDLAVANKI